MILYAALRGLYHQSASPESAVTTKGIKSPDISSTDSLKSDTMGIEPNMSPMTESPFTSLTAPSSLESCGLQDQIAELERSFEYLVDEIEESFIQNGVCVHKIQRSVKHIPISLKLQLGEYFMEQSSKILRTKSIEELFILLSFMWDYLNPGLLEYLVGRFGSENDIVLLRAYLEKLGTFRASVKLGDYVHARHNENSAYNHFCYKKIVAIMGHGWESRTLQDAEDFKVEFAKECHFQQFLPRIHAEVSSIALIFCMPHWIEIDSSNIKALFKKNNVVKFYTVCVMNWIEEVNTPTKTPYLV